MKNLKIYSALLLMLFFAASTNVYAQARVQIIHNSADAAAASVDVWLNGTKLLSNFEFRTATPFIDAPAGELLNIGIAPPNSTSWTQSFNIKQVVLTEDQTYVIVANGIASTSGYMPAPTFNVSVYPVGREEASQAGNTDVLVVHGSTDAPTVDVYETGVGAGLIVNDLSYSNVAGYLELETLDYVIEVRDQTGTTTVAAYQAPLATLGLEGAALTVVASGFLNPANNSNGPAFGLWAALSAGGPLVELPAYSPSGIARVQVIHNAADAAAAMVDVWLDDTKLIEDFAFRTATPFIDAPAGVEFTIAIQAPGSTSPDNPIWSQSYTLADDETYVLVANGLVDDQNYTPFQGFDIYVYAMGREVASSPSNTDILVFHGSTDAPVVDVVEVGAGAGTIIDDLAYGDFAGYLELPTADYSIQIRNQAGTDVVVQYAAPLETLQLNGAALTVVASGFLNPANNNDGPAFGLYVASPLGGDLLALPVVDISTARVQVIHNAADAAAASVDVWLNDTKLIEDFAFRTATPFIDAPAGVEFTIAIQAPGSTSPANPIWSQDYTLAGGERYVLVANGLVDDQNYTPFQGFDIYVYAMGREEASMADQTDVLVFHGSTDAPTVSIWETAVVGDELFSFSYGDFAGYLELPTLDFVIEVRDETGTTTVAAYQAPLATLGLEGAALSVVASGFLNPATNNNGAPFGLYVALAGGGDLIALPLYDPQPTARVQVIHNAADAAAASVDVWLNDTKLIEDFAFRTATPFIDAPAGVEFTIAIQAPGSSSPENPIWSQSYTLEADETYVLVANGLVDDQNYTPFQGFDIYVYAMGREVASDPSNTDILVFHGSTDAPVVDVVEIGVGAGTIIDDLAYGDFAGYLELPTTDYTLDIRDETGTVTVASYAAPLATLELDGAALVVVASGFLNPANNNNGPAFGLYVALASGGELVPLPVVTSIAERNLISAVNIYPNPVVNQFKLDMQMENAAAVSIEIFNLLGAKVYEQNFGTLSSGIHSNTISIDRLPEGLYLLRINSGNSPLTQKIKITR